MTNMITLTQDELNAMLLQANIDGYNNGLADGYDDGALDMCSTLTKQQDELID